MMIERYSHVMHIVSNVVGELPGKTAWDLFKACFPAGTVVAHQNPGDGVFMNSNTAVAVLFRCLAITILKVN